MTTATLPESPAALPPFDAPEPDGLYEVVDGVFVEKPHVGAYELVFANDLADLLKSFPGVRDLGRVVVEVIFDLRPALDRERRPDLAFVSYERSPRTRRVPQASSWAVTPELVIEVVSPTNTASAVKEKIREYFLAGVGRVWVVYPTIHQVEDYDSPTSVRIVEAGGILDASGLWPGCRIEVARIFAEG